MVMAGSFPVGSKNMFSREYYQSLAQVYHPGGNILSAGTGNPGSGHPVPGGARIASSLYGPVPASVIRAN
jgi:spermidine synthase